MSAWQALPVPSRITSKKKFIPVNRLHTFYLPLPLPPPHDLPYFCAIMNSPSIKTRRQSIFCVCTNPAFLFWQVYKSLLQRNCASPNLCHSTPPSAKRLASTDFIGLSAVSFQDFLHCPCDMPSVQEAQGLGLEPVSSCAYAPDQS